MTLYSGPIQGITTATFRRLVHRHFGGVDRFFAPYIRFDGAELRPSKLADLLPIHNAQVPTVPQVMCQTADEFLALAQRITDLGYNEINWNLGCPYPMVTNRGLGADLLTRPDEVLALLDRVLPQVACQVSIKARRGLVANDDLCALLPRLNAYPLSEIVIHPRYARQLYKGLADRAHFAQCQSLSTHALCYNGDITHAADAHAVLQQYAPVQRLMLGRGLVANPFLAAEIKGEPTPSDHEKRERFGLFVDELADELLQQYDANQSLLRLRSYWEYFAHSFADAHRAYKHIKKAHNLAAYRQAVRQNMDMGWAENAPDASRF